MKLGQDFNIEQELSEDSHARLFQSLSPMSYFRQKRGKTSHNSKPCDIHIWSIAIYRYEKGKNVTNRQWNKINTVYYYIIKEFIVRTSTEIPAYTQKT